MDLLRFFLPYLMNLQQMIAKKFLQQTTADFAVTVRPSNVVL